MPREDERFMHLALACAAKGRGAVEPNPTVGAIIVREGVEIARGWHRRFGGPHAEVEALAAAREAGQDVRGAALYVTLEPCCHHGKTPPCTDAIIEAGLARVVVAMTDPDEHVAGRGIAALRAAGIEVTVGVCEAEAARLLAPYVKLRTRRRPWVICKWAQTADGYLVLPPGEGRWISNAQSRADAHVLRSRCDGVCVGIGTVLADDPLLTNRSGGGRQPARVVLDSKLRTPPDCAMLRAAGGGAVIVATTAAGLRDGARAAAALRAAGAELLELPAGAGGVDLPALLDELGRREWTYLLVEGGAALLRRFIELRLADELVAFVSPRAVGAAAELPRLDVEDVRRELCLGDGERRQFGRDVRRRFRVTEA